MSQVTLSIVIGTFNRLEMLHKSLAALKSGVHIDHEIIVVDAGSTDGTLKYLEQLDDIHLIKEGKLIGQAKSLNRVINNLESKYVCWLSDDNVIVDGALDKAVKILEGDHSIGMVSLKVKDMVGPLSSQPYIGGISRIGVLNCNQGMLPTQLMRTLGGFDENMRDYGIDVDLTTRVLLTGFKVVTTKQIAIHHYRDHSSSSWISPEERIRRLHSLIQAYVRKYSYFERLFLAGNYSQKRLETLRLKKIEKLFVWVQRKNIPLKRMLSLNERDRYNIICSRFISNLDFIFTRNKPYYLVQKMPAYLIFEIRLRKTLSHLKAEVRESGIYTLSRNVLRLLWRTQLQASIWSGILKKPLTDWKKNTQSSQIGMRVLIASSMGGFQQGVLLESTLSVALTLRNADVDILLCDSYLPACQLTEIGKVSPEDLLSHFPQQRCSTCAPDGKSQFAPLGLQVYWFSQLVSSEKLRIAEELSSFIRLDDISEYRLDGLSVGEHAQAGALRYFARGDFHAEPMAEKILRLYLKAALLTVFATRELIRKNKYEVAVFNHGLYVPQGLIGEVCRQEGIRVVNWNPAYRKHCFIFSPGDTYHHTMISESVSTWENIQWTPEIEKRTMDYLKSRWQGTEDWIWFHDEPEEDIDKIVQETGANPLLPWVGLFTNVMWDAQLHYRSNAFPSMLDWVLQTIAYFDKRPEVHLLIRVHPAELRGGVPSRQPLVAEINRMFAQLPPNVFVISPESQISTYALAQHCNAALIYNTKTGIEISSMGIPVVVAGEAWIRGKGFSIDASSPDEYFSILDQLPFSTKLNHLDLERARKYAFHFFFRRMIPLPFIQSTEKFKFTLDIQSIEQLKPGYSPGLDVICEGILRDKPFVYLAERMKSNEDN